MTAHAHAPAPRAARTAVLVSCMAMAAVATGFLLFGEFGGWYYAEGGVRTTTEYDYDNDQYNVRHTPTGNQYWDSDRLFTEPTLIAPLTIAVLSLGASITCLLKAWLGQGDGRRAMKRAGDLGGIATLTLLVWSIVYASSMGEVTDWWFGAAFYTGLINSALLTAVAFGSLQVKAWWGQRPDADPAAP